MSSSGCLGGESGFSVDAVGVDDERSGVGLLPLVQSKECLFLSCQMHLSLRKVMKTTVLLFFLLMLLPGKQYFSLRCRWPVFCLRRWISRPLPLIEACVYSQSILSFCSHLSPSLLLHRPLPAAEAESRRWSRGAHRPEEQYYREYHSEQYSSRINNWRHFSTTNFQSQVVAIHFIAVVVGGSCCERLCDFL